MKKILIGFLVLISFSSFASNCNEDFIYDVIDDYERENPYADGEFEYMIQDISLADQVRDTFKYDVIIHYEYSEGGYRLLEINVQELTDRCKLLKIELIEDN